MNRRALLRGAGAAWLLPPLASLAPRGARAAPTVTPRLLVWFVPNGMIGEEVTPTAGVFPSVMSALAPLRARVSAWSGLENRASQGGGSHERCLPSLLSDREATNFQAGPLSAGVTIDQLIAQRLAGTAPYSSLVLGTGEPFGNASGNLPVYYNSLSWTAPVAPAPRLDDPKLLFDRLFGGSVDQNDARRALRKSVLDAVVERSAALRPALDPADQGKLDQFETGVRELELRIDRLAAVSCDRPDAPAPNLPFMERVDTTTDLLVLALQCGYTRVASYMLGPTTALTTYPQIGVTKAHHTISHDYLYREQDRVWFLAIHQWHFERWAALLERLAAVPTPTGDLLSETLVALVTEFSEASHHVAVPVPMVLAGGEAAGVSQGHDRAFPSLPHSNLLRAFGGYMGVDTSAFGDNATGTVDLGAPA
ncbi:MAG: DUF1552 domain-containing protein [Myxococcota bacterium]